VVIGAGPAAPGPKTRDPLGPSDPAQGEKKIPPNQASSPPPAEPTKKKNKVPIAAIAGGIGGVLVLVALAGLALCGFLYKKRAARGKSPPADPAKLMPPPGVNVCTPLSGRYGFCLCCVQLRLGLLLVIFRATSEWGACLRCVRQLHEARWSSTLWSEICCMMPPH
jgi:hypothetical protein